MQTVASKSQAQDNQALTESATERLQTSLQKNPETGKNEHQKLSPDLAGVVAAWPELPEHIKAAIKTLVQSSIHGVQK